MAKNKIYLLVEEFENPEYGYQDYNVTEHETFKKAESYINKNYHKLVGEEFIIYEAIELYRGKK